LQIVIFSKSSKFAFLLVSEIILGMLLIGVSLVVFLKLAEVILTKEVISFDVWIRQLIYVFRNPTITMFMKDITFLGGDVFLGCVIIITILLLLRKHKKDAAVFSFILFFGIALNIFLKNIFQRPRPTFIPLIHETSYSFPSAHAMNSLVFFLSLSYFIFINTRNEKLGIVLTFLSGFLVFFIGISRIYLGAHYPSDVLGGYVAGLCWFALVLVFEKTLLFLRLFKKFEVEKKY